MGTNPRGEVSKKLAVVSTDGKPPSKSARIGALSDKHRLEGIFVPRRQGSEEDKIEVEQLVKARDLRDCAAFSLVLKNPEVMACVRQG